MKTRQYVLVLTLLAGIPFVSALVRAQPPLPDDRYSLISRPHPALAGVDIFRLSILRLGARAENDGLVWAELAGMVTDKLKKAGIELSPGSRYGDPNMPELRVYIEMLKLEASQQYVFRIQTSLARSTHLTEQLAPIFKADVWKLNPVMQAASVEDMPAEVADVVLDQVNVFIRAYRATNPPDSQSSDTGMHEPNAATASEKNAGAYAKSAPGAGKYVASNSSGIFHRPDCRWAGNISPENLVTYRTRDEAMSSGKRPCKSCEP
ncbi:MAG: Ada metal-binding domain-containing protein [Planctomycetota bacterium]